MEIGIKFLLICISTGSLVNSMDFNTREGPLVTTIRRSAFNYFQRFQLKDIYKQQQMQTVYPKTFPFFCDDNKYLKRSIIRPTSVNQLRPGDIDIIAAMGDSLTGGNGIMATNILDIIFENRGLSFPIGGQGSWREHLTLPNILKEFNSNLYGYSLKTTVSTERASRFNVAENAAASSDMIYQARILKQRFEHDKNVNMKNDWKMVTMYFGGIDFCHLACKQSDHNLTLIAHQHDLLKVLRYIRDNIPRTIVNIQAAPNIMLLVNETKRPDYCNAYQTILCPCFSVFKTKSFISRGAKLIKDWHKMDTDIADRDEFHTDDFTVNIANYFNDVKFIRKSNGDLDLKYFSVDCFHFSQRFHAIASVKLWNQLLQPYGQRENSTNLTKPWKFKCPNENNPYLRTKLNSQ